MTILFSMCHQISLLAITEKTQQLEDLSKDKVLMFPNVAGFFFPFFVSLQIYKHDLLPGLDLLEVSVTGRAQ